MTSVEKILEDNRYNMAITYIVNCLGVTEIYTKETREKLLRHWGKEDASVFFLNTRELVVNIH